MKTLPATLENVAYAAEVLNRGGIVAMPTETVYGIAVDAMNEDAVRRLFALKGRPADNPLIVHISDFAQIGSVVEDIPETARRLAERFWPGPLTLVMAKHPDIPRLVTGGRPTVAVRLPRHPVAVSLISLLGRPVAAPSANRFMRLSATRVEHLDEEIVAGLDVVLDGGPCPVGVESTVLDLTEEPPQILRPGGVSRGDIQAAIGSPLYPMLRNSERRSPGMYTRHYAPKSPTHLVERLSEDQTGLVLDRPAGPHQVKMPLDPQAYAATLYDALHRLDLTRPAGIYVQKPPDLPEWEAVLDRLAKACGG